MVTGCSQDISASIALLGLSCPAAHCGWWGLQLGVMVGCLPWKQINLVLLSLYIPYICLIVWICLRVLVSILWLFNKMTPSYETRDVFCAAQQRNLDAKAQLTMWEALNKYWLKKWTSFNWFMVSKTGCVANMNHSFLVNMCFPFFSPVLKCHFPRVWPFILKWVLEWNVKQMIVPRSKGVSITRCVTRSQWENFLS